MTKIAKTIEIETTHAEWLKAKQLNFSDGLEESWMKRFVSRNEALVENLSRQSFYQIGFFL